MRLTFSGSGWENHLQMREWKRPPGSRCRGRPAYQFNKHTSTNLGLDYGWGRGDSDGLFLGMTEVF
jgi:hypothetical protein